jgi:hypothetical protein
LEKKLRESHYTTKFTITRFKKNNNNNDKNKIKNKNIDKLIFSSTIKKKNEGK